MSNSKYKLELKRQCKSMGYTANELKSMSTQEMHQAIKNYGYKIGYWNQLRKSAGESK